MAQVRYERLNTEISRLDPDENEEAEIELDIRRPNVQGKVVQFSNNEHNYFEAVDEIYNGDSEHRIQPPATSTQILRPRIMQMAIGTLFVLLLYLTFSICLINYQHRIVKKYKYPFTIVTYHLVTKFLLSSCFRAIYKWRTGKIRVQMDFRTSLQKLAPTGMASGIDIGFSTWGLEIVSIPLYTMTKSTAIIFILIFSILMGLEKKGWLLVLTVGFIAFGLFLFTYKSTSFNAFGFILLLIGSFSSGIRWNLAQFLMQKSKLDLHNPIDMIYHMQPWMILSLVPFLLVWEANGLHGIIRDLPNNDGHDVLLVILYITFGAILAFFMEVSEFLALSRTSGLTLSIAGIFKDVFLITFAVVFEDEKLNFINVIGLIICLAGVSCHVLHKYIILTRSVSLQQELEENSPYNDELNLNPSNGVFSAIQRSNNLSNTTPDKHSNLTVPLLDQIEDHESSDDSDGPNASDVIFDVLKRRDMTR